MIVPCLAGIASGNSPSQKRDIHSLCISQKLPKRVGRGWERVLAMILFVKYEEGRLLDTSEVGDTMLDRGLMVSDVQQHARRDHYGVWGSVARKPCCGIGNREGRAACADEIDGLGELPEGVG